MKELEEIEKYQESERKYQVVYHICSWSLKRTKVR